jgi:hypothetical protein
MYLHSSDGDICPTIYSICAGLIGVDHILTGCCTFTNQESRLQPGWLTLKWQVSKIQIAPEVLKEMN